MSKLAGRSVPGLPERAAVDAADPARREDPDPGRVGRDHRRRDRGGRPAAFGERDGQARPGGLADRCRPARSRARAAQPRIQADEDPAVMDRDGRRDRAALADRGLRRARDLDVLRIRQAVADQGGLEGDDRRCRRAARRRPRARSAGGRVSCRQRSRARRPHDGPANRTRPHYTGRVSARRPMTPADIRRQVVLDEHDMAADGSLAVVVEAHRPARPIPDPPASSCRSASTAPRALSAGRPRRARSRAEPCATAGRASPRTPATWRSSGS